MEKSKWNCELWWAKAKRGKNVGQASGSNEAAFKSRFLCNFPYKWTEFSTALSLSVSVSLQPHCCVLCAVCCNFTTLSTFLPLAKVNSINFLPLLWQLQQQRQWQQRQWQQQGAATINNIFSALTAGRKRAVITQDNGQVQAATHINCLANLKSWQGVGGRGVKANAARICQDCGKCRLTLTKICGNPIYTIYIYMV